MCNRISLRTSELYSLSVGFTSLIFHFSLSKICRNISLCFSATSCIFRCISHATPPSSPPLALYPSHKCKSLDSFLMQCHMIVIAWCAAYTKDGRPSRHQSPKLGEGVVRVLSKTARILFRHVNSFQLSLLWYNIKSSSKHHPPFIFWWTALVAISERAMKRVHPESIGCL